MRGQDGAGGRTYPEAGPVRSGGGDLRHGPGDLAHPRAPPGLGQGPEEEPGVEGVVLGGQDTAAHGRRQHGLQPAALTAAEPFGGDPQPFLEGVQIVQYGQIVPVEGDQQGAGAAMAHRPAARGLHLGDEVVVHPRGAQAQGHQLLLAEHRLGGGGQHARGDGRGGTGVGRFVHRIGLDQRDVQAPLGGPPRGDAADDAAAHHDHGIGRTNRRVGGFLESTHGAFLHSLRRHDPDQVRAVGDGQSPSQPGPPGSRGTCLFGTPS